MSTCIVSMILDEEERICRFVRYHRNLGVDEIIVFLDNGDDGLAKRLSAIDGVTALPGNREFWATFRKQRPDGPMERQVRYVNRGLHLARERGHDWIIHIDIDELLFPEGPIEHLLDQQGTEIVRFSIREAVAESPDETDLYSPTCFRRVTSPRREYLAKVLTARRPFFEGAYFRGHTRSKVAVRISDNLKRIRIHSAVLYDDGPESVSQNIRLLHFDSVGLGFWKTKWSHVKPNGDYSRRSPTRRRLAEQCWRLNGKPLRTQERIFRRIFMLSGYSRFVLGKLGMTERIGINRDLFRKLPGE